MLLEPVVDRCGALSDRPSEQQHRRHGDRRPQADSVVSGDTPHVGGLAQVLRASSTMLTSRALAVTGGFQRVSTMRLSSSGVTEAMYSSVTLCTPW